MTDSSNDNRKLQLPGYKLQKLLGAGGYGEVWLADAPGGLTKAVKVIFGFHNEKRAASELKSLEKIKSVRHPFLLSLERIEVIEGRLVIVSELADCSVKDRFEHFREAGQVGIPRGELLGYLRDSADALDYLSNNHSLQHLDIKPENLLLLAGHVKVADFGLVKKIQDTQASLVGGMTPLYSAPEVFQGTPTSFSDQYSLGVLFQEMLTGKLPFDGNNAAELTLQHMHDEPDLSPLPVADRYIIARALSKEPKQRYSSCREFVEALLNVDPSKTNATGDWGAPRTPTPSSQAAPSSDLRKSRPGTMTQVFEDDLIENPADISTSMILELPTVEDEEFTGIPAFELQEGDVQPVPTLVIGIGGTAGNVLSQYRRQLSERFGDVPSVQLLLLDTDKKSLVETTHSGSDVSLTSDETLALQLRRPQEYRDSSKRLLGWLSRRWLYNIPKSLRTEGLRPLGRLAFADHARRTIQRIRLSISNAMDESAIERSNAQTGLKFNGKAIRVYVVASISGGSGSGMSIDVGYAVKGLLQKLGIEDATTTGILLHSTGRDSRYCDLAKVNAFSWFKEYNHFSRPEGYYPGDEASGLPAMPAGTPLFDDAYFLNLGDGLSLDQLEVNTQAVAKYLMLDTMTSARKFFDAHRQAAPCTVGGMPALRTFGLHEQATISRQALNVIAQQLSQRVVLGWTGRDHGDSLSEANEPSLSDGQQDTASVSDTSQIISGAPQAVASLHMNLEGISASARTILESQFGTEPDQMVTRLLEQAEQSNADLNPVETVKLVDSLFLAESNIEKRSADFVLGRRLDAVVSPLGMRLARDLHQWLMQRLDNEQERLAGTRQAAEWFAEHFKRVEADAKRLARGISNKILTIVNSVSESGDPSHALSAFDSAGERNAFAIKYFRLRVDLSALQATGHLVRTLQSELKNLREAIVEFGRHLRHLADRLDVSNDAVEQPSLSANPISQSLLIELPNLANKVDQQLQEQYINPAGGLFQTVTGNRKVISDLLEALQSISAEHVSLASRELSRSSGASCDMGQLIEHSEKARPLLADLGGFSRQIVVMPCQDLANGITAEVRETLGEDVSIVGGASGNMVLCNEVGSVPLSRVAIDLIECRRDYADFADRVHTRNDISWAPLLESAVPVASGKQEFATQVLSQVF